MKTIRKSGAGFRIAIFALLILGLSCIALSLYMGFGRIAEGDQSLGETGLNEEYSYGQTITVPAADMTVDGETVSVQPVIYLPDGRACQDSQLTLDQLGQYRLEYSVNKGGSTYTQTDSFYVYEYLAYNTVTNEPLKYGTNETYEASGLQFSVKPSEQVKYNRAINLSNVDPEEPFITVDAVPETPGTPEARDLYLMLTDIYDADNYITIRIRRAPMIEDQDAGYISAAHAGQPLSGWIESLGQFYVGHENYGTGTMNGLQGNWDKTNHISFYFDYANRILYTYDGANRTKVVNFLTDFDNPWGGFTTGEVFITLWADTYATSNVLEPFNGIILDIAGEDLSEGVAEDGTVPLYRVENTQAPIPDFGEYETVENIPDAMVGYPYKVFGYTLNSVYGAEKVYKHVYYGYYTSSRYELPIENDCFVPLHEGVHTIVYTTVDRFGNSESRYVDVYAEKNAGTEFTLYLPGYENYTEGSAGHRFELLGEEDLYIDGNLGNVRITIQAQHKESGKVVDASAGYFIPEDGGTWTISYTAVDYNGRVGYFAYDAEVAVDKEVIFGEINNFPKYAIVGTENTLPECLVKDYNAGGEERPADRIYVEKDNVFVAELEGRVFIPDSAGEYVIVYEAVSAVGTTSTIKRNITAVDVGLGTDDFDMTKYFYSEGLVSADADATSVSLVVKENAVINFIRPIDAVNFSFSFNIGKTVKTAERIVMTITDSNNSDQSIELAFIKAGEGVKLSINGGEEQDLPNFKFGNGADFTVKISLGELAIDKSTFKLTEYVNKQPYEGFESLSAYVTLRAETAVGVSGNTEILVSEVSGQNFYDATGDGIEPTIIMSEQTRGKYLPGETVKIGYALAIDVLDPAVTASLTVMGPDGQPLKDIDGLTLQNVAIDRDYYVTPSVMGTYRILYTYFDGTGNGQRDRGPVFQLVSREAPVITLNGTQSEAELGSVVTVAEATAVSQSPSVDIYIFVQRPTGNLKELPKYDSGENNGEYNRQVALNEAGEYLVRYMAVDEWFNISIAEYTINVA